MKNKKILHRLNLLFMAVAIFATSGICHAIDLWPYVAISQDGSTVIGTDDDIAFSLIDGVTTSLGTLGGSWSEPRALSPDGTVIVGQSDVVGIGSHAFRWADGVMTDLGTIPGGNSSYATALSADGAVVVGSASNGTVNHAFRWADNVMTDLGTLGGDESQAWAVSADGTVVAGHAANADNDWRAFRYVVGGSMTDLGTLGGDESVATAMSDDGTVVVGRAQTGSGQHAFRWVDGVMTDLDPDSGNSSNAYGISADGAVVMGYVDTGSGSHAFRWANGVMVDLGTLGGDISNPQAISADGTTIVGGSYTDTDGGSPTAFRWNESTGMISVADWLGDDVSLAGWDLDTANGVSADGSVLIGYGTDPDGNEANWMARKGAASGSGTGGSSGSALINPVEWLNTVFGTTQIFHTGTQLSTLAMCGSHHRPLMSYDQIGEGLGFWITGDMGKFNDELDLVSGSAEVGMYNDYADGRLRAGLGLGYSGQRQDLPLAGSSDLDGGYLIGEINYRPELDASLIASVTTIFGAWDAEVNRGYLNGSAVDHSTGDTDVKSAAIRVKIDWQDALRLGSVRLDPYAGLTFTHTSVDSYTETNGSVPAQFDAQKHDAQELRIGVAGITSLSEVMRLRLTVEGVERFDDRGPALSGQDIGGFGISFDLPGEEIRRNWVRGGIDVDYTINDSSMLATSINFANQGQDPDVSGAISYRMRF